MSVYLILIVLALPGQDAPRAELTRAFISASSASVCQRHADKLADEQRQAQADTVRRLNGKVYGVCVLQGSMP